MLKRHNALSNTFILACQSAICYSRLINERYVQENHCSLHIKNCAVAKQKYWLDAAGAGHVNAQQLSTLLIQPSRVDMNFGQCRSGRWCITAMTAIELLLENAPSGFHISFHFKAHYYLKFWWDERILHLTAGLLQAERCIWNLSSQCSITIALLMSREQFERNREVEPGSTHLFNVSLNLWSRDVGHWCKGSNTLFIKIPSNGLENIKNHFGGAKQRRGTSQEYTSQNSMRPAWHFENKGGTLMKPRTGLISLSFKCAGHIIKYNFKLFISGNLSRYCHVCVLPP